MSSPAAQFNAIGEACLEATRQLALSSLENAENLFKLSLRATREVLVKDDNEVSAVWFDDKITKVWAEWPALHRDHVQKAWDMVRVYIEGASKAQIEFARFFQDQVAIGNQNFIDSIQGFAGIPGAVGPGAEAVEHKPKKATASRNSEGA